jgi:hypothetical protein
MALERISSGKIVGYTNEGEQGSPIYEQFLKDSKTGDLYESITSQNYDSEGMISSYNYNPGRLLATGAALNNPDIQNLTNSYNWRGINNPGEKYADPVEAQKLYTLKQENPSQYYQKLATDISDQILGNWSMNKNEHNVALTNQLENFKDVSPTAYYQAQLNLLSKQSGWQHGQNTFERAKPYQEKMAELAPKALEAGLSAQQIDSIVGQGFSAASAQNQQRIVNEQQSGGGGFNLGEVVRGVTPVAALALGGPLFSAIGAGAAAGTIPSLAASAGQGALIGAAMGGGGAVVRGGDVLQGLALGGATGAVGGGLGASLGGGFTGNVAGGALSGGTGSLLRGGDPLQGALAGAAGGAILSGVNAFVDTSTGLFNQTNTGSTQMDELFGPSYAELGYTPDMGPTYAELGYTPGGFSDAGAYPGFMEDIGLAGSSSGLTDLSGTQGSAVLQSLGLGAGDFGFDTKTITNLVKQFGAQAVKSLIGGGAQTATNAARRAQLKAQGYTDAQINAMEMGTGLLGAGANYFLNQSQLGKLQDAYGQNVSAQQAATQQAQQQASFTPVGMTTAFGQSNFQFDPTTGKLTSAGYTPTAQVAGQVQNLFGLGAQALPTTADTQAVQQQYIAQQQGLLAPGREQQLAQLRNRQFQRGTTGLATGGTMAGYTPNAQGLMATNPEMAAYYNAQAQQNAALAANAPTYAQNLLNQQIATGTGLFGAANTLEQYAQQPLALSSSLGAAGAGAGAKAGYYGLLGSQGAQATQLQGQLANIYGQGAALGSAVSPLVTAAGQGIGSVIGEWLK